MIDMLLFHLHLFHCNEMESRERDDGAEIIALVTFTSSTDLPLMKVSEAVTGTVRTVAGTHGNNTKSLYAC